MQTNYTQFRLDSKGVKIKKQKFLKIFIIFTLKDLIKDQNVVIRKWIKKVHIKDTEYRSNQVIIHVEKQRYVCSCCKKTVTSKLDFVDFNHSISTNVRKEVENKIKDIKSFTQVSKELKISISSVLIIFDSIVIPIKDLDTNILYMDEFKGNADGEK